MAADGSRFKAVNTRDKNYTPGAIRLRLAQVEASIERYLDKLDTADRQEADVAEMRTTRLNERIAALRQQMRTLQAMAHEVETAPDRQISLTDPDSRSMISQAKGTGVVGYNVQVAVDARHHLIVTHEVTNVGNDRTQLSPMAKAARDAMGKKKIKALADRGYFSAPEIKACDDAGIAALVPKSQTSGAKADGRFDRADFGNDIVADVAKRLDHVLPFVGGRHLEWLLAALSPRRRGAKQGPGREDSADLVRDQIIVEGLDLACSPRGSEVP